MCTTSWLERDASYERIYLAIPHIVEAFEVMNGTHPELRSFKKIQTDKWETKSKKEATLFLNILTDFEFIIITLYRLMQPIASITQQLQERAIDVVSTYTEVKDCISDIDYLRNSIKDEFPKIYQQVVRMGMKLSVTPSIPRNTIRQQHRNNISSENPGEYYKRATTIPLLDRLTRKRNFRFTKFSNQV